jgi:hypothetical protein
MGPSMMGGKGPPRPRARQPSVPELAQDVEKLRAEVAVITKSHDIPPVLSSSPPGLRFVQRKIGKLVLRLLLAALLGSASWYGGWLARDCQHHLETAPATIPP